MRQIGIAFYENSFHPCEVCSLKYNKITDIYHLYYYDRVMADYYMATLEKRGNNYFLLDFELQSDSSIWQVLASYIYEECDITNLPALLKREDEKMKNVFISRPEVPSSLEDVKVLEYLEIISYENALNYPTFYYFIIQKMDVHKDYFDYEAKIVEKSNKRLKKNIIARHKLLNPITDYPNDGLIYKLRLRDKDIADPNLETEAILVKKIIELNRGRRSDMDPILLTKIVRMILSQEDYLKAAREYEYFMNKYYDKWIAEKTQRNK